MQSLPASFGKSHQLVQTAALKSAKYCGRVHSHNHTMRKSTKLHTESSADFWTLLSHLLMCKLPAQPAASGTYAQPAVRARMQGFNLHKLNLMKSKDNKNVQTAQVTQEVPQLPMKNAVLYVQQLKKQHVETGFQPEIELPFRLEEHTACWQSQHGSILPNKRAAAIYF